MKEIVIKIPEEVYEEIQRKFLNTKVNKISLTDRAILNGTPLTKGHGRLIDANAFDETLSDGELKARKYRKYVLESAINTIRGNLAIAPTIIEADKEATKDGFA